MAGFRPPDSSCVEVAETGKNELLERRQNGQPGVIGEDDQTVSGISNGIRLGDVAQPAGDAGNSGSLGVAGSAGRAEVAGAKDSGRSNIIALLSYAIDMEGDTAEFGAYAGAKWVAVLANLGSLRNISYNSDWVASSNSSASRGISMRIKYSAGYK